MPASLTVGPGGAERILLAGRGGGTLSPGRHVRYAKDTPLANLYLDMLDRMGVHQERFGDSTGHLSQLTV